MKNSILKITKEDLIDTSLFVNWNEKERTEVFEKVNKIYDVKNLARILNHDKTTIYEIRTGKVKPSTKLYFYFMELLSLKINFNSLSLSSRNAKPIKIKDLGITPELVGLIHSDGHLNLMKHGKGQIFYFSNQHKELIERFCELILDTFECNIFVKKDKRDDTYYAYPPSVVGRIIAKKIGWKTRDYPNLDFSDDEIPLYITGLFDGDGTIYIYKNSKTVIPTVKITTDSKFHAENIKRLLNKIDIYSRIVYETRNSWKWCSVIITRQKDFLKFIKMVDSKHSVKKAKIEGYLNNLGDLFNIKSRG